MRQRFVQFPQAVALAFLAGVVLAFCPKAVCQSTERFVDRAERQFLQARALYEKESTNIDAAWKFGRATFDRAEFSKDNAERESFARQGIAACRFAVEQNPGLAAGHYYLGMNLAQLARTKSLGALKILRQIEQEFLAARELDQNFDFAGPDRNLGLIYMQAPSFSIGDKDKAREHLRRAVMLHPGYPENHLNMLEAYLRWGDKKSAREEAAELQAIWPQAKQKLQGPEWEASWDDWEKRFEKAQRKLEKQ